MTLPSLRQLELLTLAREAGDRVFDPATGLCLIGRDTLWYAASLLFDPLEPRQEFGRNLIESVQSQDGTHTPATMLAILCALRDRLTSGTVAHLEQEVARELVHAAEVQWHDGNVNHPLAAWCTLVLGGELSGASWSVELGLSRMREFRRLTGDRHFKRRRQAEMSEYNSLTYTALDILFLALIAEYSTTRASRSLALWLEQRFWLDIALHFHAPSQQFAGPHSRSYQDDSTGGFSALHTLVYAAGRSELFLYPGLCVQFNHPSSLLQCALSGIVPLHPTDEALNILLHKPFPFLMQKTTYCEQYHENSWRQIRVAGVGEQGGGERVFAFDEETYPGGLRDLTTYMTEEYALGTASLPYVNGGHSDGVMLRVRRASAVGAMADFRSAFTRGVFNSATLGRRNSCHVTGSAIDESYLYEEGRCAVYQHRNRAIVFYTPKRAGHRGVGRFEVQLIFGYYAPFTALAFGDRRVEQPARDRLVGALRTPLFFQDYHTLGAVFPLALSPAAGDTPVRLHVQSDHLIYSLVSYDGPARDFTRDEITGWRTGFALILATLEEFPDFDAFLRYARALKITESVSPAGVRTAALEHPYAAMRAVYDPFRELFLERTWNELDETVDHLHIEAGAARERLIDPLTLFGAEAMREGR